MAGEDTAVLLMLDKELGGESSFQRSAFSSPSGAEHRPFGGVGLRVTVWRALISGTPATKS
jgi:hypothetical protein